MVEIFSIFSPNGNLVKLERIRVLTTRVEPLASRLVLVMIRVPVQAFLAITYIRLTLRGSYTGVSIYSLNRCISYIIFIRSISIIYGLIVDPHNDQLSVGLIAQVKWSMHCTGIAEVTIRVHVQAFLATTSRQKLRGLYTFVPIRSPNKCISCIDIIPLNSKISPGAYIFQRPCLRGLFLEGLIFEGSYKRWEICGTKSIGLAYSWKAIEKKIVTKLFLLYFILYLRAIFKYKYSEGRFNGGFFALRVWGPYNWRGLFSEFCGTYK